MKLQILKQARVDLQTELVELLDRSNKLKNLYRTTTSGTDRKIIASVQKSKDGEIKNLQTKIACLNLWITDLEGQYAENI